MDRLVVVKNAVDTMMKECKDNKMIIGGVLTLHGVSLLCSLLAKRRNLDAEICGAAGVLYKYCSFRMGKDVSDTVCASEAEKVLRTLGCFSRDEMQLIYRMILNHSKIDETGDVYEEVLKDAEILLPYLYSGKVEMSEYNKHSDNINTKRLNHILVELNLI